MEHGPASRKREIIATLAVLLIIVAIVGAVTVTNKKQVASNATTATSTPVSTPESTTSSPSSTASTGSFKDGEYTSTGGYQSPGGFEKITIHITLKNDVVTDTSAKSGATDGEAEEYQSKFMSGYKKLVVGKKLTDISLSRVSGSSLTSIGFNNALDQIKSQAKA